MPAVEPLCHLLGISYAMFSKEENLLIEAELFLRICEQLKEIFKYQHRLYFQSIKTNPEEELIMLESSFTRSILRDILASGEYTMQGIACYTDTHEDVIEDLVSGFNTKPTAASLRKIIELHRMVRKELYQAIGKKLIDEYLSAEHEEDI